MTPAALSAEALARALEKGASEMLRAALAEFSPDEHLQFTPLIRVLATGLVHMAQSLDAAA